VSPPDTESSTTELDLRRHLQQLTALHEVNTHIASVLDPDQVLARVLDSLDQLVSYHSAALYLLDLDAAVPAAGRLVVASVDAPARLRADRAFAGRSLTVSEGAVAADNSVVVAAMRGQQTVGTPGFPSGLAAVPLLAGGHALGALELRLVSALGEEEVKILELLAAAAAVALQNAHLYQETQRLATTDALTGLANYRHFHDLLGLEVQRARRMGYPVGLLIMDLDHFKSVNDRHGHPKGDVALRQVADQLKKRLRRTDVVGRIGGEEFGAVLPGDRLGEVAIVAEKLRQAVQELPPLRGGISDRTTYLTASIGGASLGPEQVDAERLIGCADQALYQAKLNGRNQVRLWTATSATSAQNEFE
jgi:diguanylate cyclase (GGDEF)-like protein